jgi:hypothetical protein
MRSRAFLIEASVTIGEILIVVSCSLKSGESTLLLNFLVPHELLKIIDKVKRYSITQGAGQGQWITLRYVSGQVPLFSRMRLSTLLADTQNGWHTHTQSTVFRDYFGGYHAVCL